MEESEETSVVPEPVDVEEVDAETIDEMIEAEPIDEGTIDEMPEAEQVVPEDYNIAFNGGEWSRDMQWSLGEDSLVAYANDSLYEAVGEDGYLVAKCADASIHEAKLQDGTIFGYAELPACDLLWAGIGTFSGDADSGTFTIYASETFANWEARNS